MEPLILEDTSLHYKTYGNPEHPSLLLINGHGRSIRDFQLMGKKLAAKNLFIITADNRGAGKTQTSKSDFNLQDIATDLIKLCDSLNQNKLHIAGFSMGGMIAQCLANLYPHKISSLYLISTSRDQANSQSIASTPWSSDYQKNFQKISLYVGEPFRKQNRLLLESMAKEITKAEHPEIDPQSRAITEFAKHPPALPINPDFMVHIVHGEQDQVFPLTSAEELASKFGNSARLHILKDSGHLLLIEKNSFLLKLLGEAIHENA